MSARAPYPAAMMTEARRLFAAGWSPTQIQVVWRQRGVERIPSTVTIRMWADERYRENQLAAHRRTHNRRTAELDGKFRLPSDTPEYQASFIARLRETGMTWVNVVRCCSVVFGGRWVVDDCKRLVGEPTIHAQRMAKERTAA